MTAKKTCARSTSSSEKTTIGCESFPGSSPCLPYHLGRDGPRRYALPPGSGSAGSSTTVSAARRGCGAGRTGLTPSTSHTAQRELMCSCRRPRCSSMSEDRSGSPPGRDHALDFWAFSLEWAGCPRSAGSFSTRSPAQRCRSTSGDVLTEAGSPSEAHRAAPILDKAELSIQVQRGRVGVLDLAQNELVVPIQLDDVPHQRRCDTAPLLSGGCCDESDLRQSVARFGRRSEELRTGHEITDTTVYRTEMSKKFRSLRGEAPAMTSATRSRNRRAAN